MRKQAITLLILGAITSQVFVPTTVVFADTMNTTNKNITKVSKDTSVKSNTANVYTDSAMTQELKNPNQYIYPKEVTLNFNGTATLDGKTITSGTKVTDAGVNILKVSNGSENKTYNFSVINNINGRDIVSVSVGDDSSAAVDSDGNLYTWGGNYYGQLGDGTTTRRCEPVKINGKGAIREDTKIVSVSTNGHGTLAIDSEGTIYAWGYNHCGQLGDGTTTTRYEPVEINGKGAIGENTKIVSVFIGYVNSSAIDNKGNLYTWGSNNYGELGDGTTTTRYEPVKINGKGDIGENTKIVSSSTEGDGIQGHSVAVDSDGNLYTWGNNNYGQLGDGTTTTRYEPVEINGKGAIGENTKIVSISTSIFNTSAIDSEGTIYTWGLNKYGELGDGTRTRRYEPVKINGKGDIGEDTKIVSISVSSYASEAANVAAVDSEGNLYTWGFNDYGALGNGFNGPGRDIPKKINGKGDIGEDTKIVSVFMGGTVCSAVDSEGNLYTWGKNGDGELGDGTTTSKYSPIETLLTIDYDNITRREDTNNFYFDIKVPNVNSAIRLAYKLEGYSDVKYVSVTNETATIIVPKTTKSKTIHFELGANINGKDSIVNNINNSVTLSLKANTPPVITAENKKIKVGDKFNPLDGVTANDKEDGNITKDIKVIENTVDTSKAGTYTVKYEVTDSVGEKSTKTITVTVEAVAKENEAISKLAYFKSYGIIFEGETSGDEKYDNTVRKDLVIKDKDGTVKLKKDIVSTNWYSNGYSGFQAILTTKDISDIGGIENAKIEIEVNYKGTVKNYDFKTAKPSGGGGGGKVVPTPPNVPPAIKPGTDLGWQSKYYYIQDLPKIEYGNSVIQFIVKKDRNIVLTNTLNDSGFNIRSYYKTNADQYVLDVVVKVKDFNMSDSQNNVFEVKKKDGQVVYTGKVATFADGVFEDAAPKSALQVIVPKEYSNDDYSVDIVIKDKNNVEKARFTAPKFS
ncbi:immunoglobulin-like domain-containing protein [Clostridium sardiniense]|uniref:RCC1 domain-containing protein n=1 Tax=Clostridium sardiniense TaxID=29369 RepID=UPI0019593D86|nr:immunoglobulin-like domain-containing protein [Clostridium sardiniense]MBM7835578.1 hypothetical protein [Clostridium sardiniense]